MSDDELVDALRSAIDHQIDKLDSDLIALRAEMIVIAEQIKIAAGDDE
jgi:hypothetical protein